MNKRTALHRFMNQLQEKGLVVDGKEVVAVATDGHRLAYSRVELAQPVVGSGGHQEIIIPRKTILECQHLLLLCLIVHILTLIVVKSMLDLNRILSCKILLKFEL